MVHLAHISPKSILLKMTESLGWVNSRTTLAKLKIAPKPVLP